MRNAGLEETQAGIKIAGRNINNLRYADDTTLKAESEEELKSLLMKVKEESEKVDLKLNIRNPKIMEYGPSIFPSMRVFSSESVLCIRWPKYWSFSFSISPSNEYSGLISFRMDWLDLLAVQGVSRVFSNTTVQKHHFCGAQLSLQSNSHIHTWPLDKP